MNFVSRQAGHRFGENVERVIPSLVQFISVDDDELREFCLQAFEALVQKCPKEVAPHIGSLTKICSDLLAYDPNYNYEVFLSTLSSNKAESHLYDLFSIGRE